MLNKTIKLSGLTCPACQKIYEMKIGSIPGVAKVAVNLETGDVKIEADREINNSEIRDSLKDTQYQLVE